MSDLVVGIGERIPNISLVLWELDIDAKTGGEYHLVDMFE